MIRVAGRVCIDIIVVVITTLLHAACMSPSVQYNQDESEVAFHMCSMGSVHVRITFSSNELIPPSITLATHDRLPPPPSPSTCYPKYICSPSHVCPQHRPQLIRTKTVAP